VCTALEGIEYLMGDTFTGQASLLPAHPAGMLGMAQGLCPGALRAAGVDVGGMDHAGMLP